MRRDRNRNGGGIVVYVAENIGFNQLENDTIVPPTDKNTEAVWFELIQPNTKRILIGAFYRPPPHLDPSTLINDLESGLANFTVDGFETILLGDLNFDYAAPNTSSTTSEGYLIWEKTIKKITDLFILDVRSTNLTDTLEEAILYLTNATNCYVDIVSRIKTLRTSNNCALPNEIPALANCFYEEK